MSATLRAGAWRDVQALAGALPVRRSRAMMQQARESDLFAIEREDGRLLVAGGFWVWTGTPYEECWMLTNRNVPLPARIVVEGVARLLDARPAGRIPVAWIDVARPVDRRFARFLGFECIRSEPETILGRRCELMVWRPACPGSLAEAPSATKP